MQQLTGMDALFLSLETVRQPMHVSGFMILDDSEAESPLTPARIKQQYTERMHLLPPLRRRLVTAPGNIDFPWWIEDPDFNIDYHIRHRALPQPGTDEQLRDLVCHIYARPLDRTRPLWEVYLIDGHESGKKILFTKTHHACIDGVSGMELLAVLVDTSANPAPPPPPTSDWRPDNVPSDADMMARTVKSFLQRPRHFMRMLPHVATSAINMGKLALAKDLETPKVPFQAPRSIFNKPGSQERDFAWGDLPLDDVMLVKNALGVKVNDLVMTICGTAMRRYCLERNALPEAPLLSMIPISVHSEEGQIGNHVSAMYCSLATDIEDPLQRLKEVAKSTLAGKAGHATVGATMLTDAAQFTSPAVVSMANRYISRVGTGDSLRPFFNCVISNVPGPRIPLYMAGAKITAQYPMSVTIDNCGLNITLISYMNKVDMGITTDKAVVPDAKILFGYISDALQEYKALALAMDKDASAKPAARKRKAAPARRKKATS